MPAKTVTVGSAIGLHARFAAGSALMIMTLGAANGVEVTVSSDDEATLDAVAALVAQDLDA